MKFAIQESLLRNSSQKLNNNIIVFDKSFEPDSKDKNDFFLFCSIEEAKRWKSKNNQEAHNVSLSYYNLNVSDFLPAIKYDYVNYLGVYKQACQLNSNDVGKFCRSNSGNKVWSGQVLDEGLIEIIKDKIQPCDLLYLSSAKAFTGCEYRCWVINEKVVEIANYSQFMLNDMHQAVDHETVKKYIEDICKFWTPDYMFVVDVCFFQNRLYIVEYNCFSTSGFYDANINKICNYINKTEDKNNV